MNIAFDTATCRSFETAVSLEWLCTNGLGGYASGTVSGANSRKYHGYLVVAAQPPVERYVMLSRTEERLTVGGQTENLSTNEFPDVVHPQGYLNLLSFRLDPGPVWRFQAGQAVIEKSLVFVHGQHTVGVKYELITAPRNAPVKLQVQPMFAGRDFHATVQADHRPNWTAVPFEDRSDQLTLAAAGVPVRLYLGHNAPRYVSGACWWYNYCFRRERMRGYPDREDLWTPGFFEYTLQANQPVGFICSTRPASFDQQEQFFAEAQVRRRAFVSAFETRRPGDDFLGQLSLAADQFLVQRGAATAGIRQMSVIAGYPWFEDWGRDTFIALPGLTLVTGRQEAARGILITFADHMKDGLLPNRFPDKSSHPDYNTVDASLWFVQAVYQYWRYTGDLALLRDYLYRPLCQIMEKYRDGTEFGIKMDADGLVRAGTPETQLTWMDAKVGNWVVTPRHGKPVEINALWYNALRIMELVCTKAGDAQRAGTFAGLAQRVQGNFAEKYFNSQTQCLFDVLEDNGSRDPAIRPNQIIAVSLPFSPLDSVMQKSVVNTVQRLLVTPMGLRTLAPGSLGYHGRYAGDQLARDMAYHQGTAWPWLIGPFVSAYVKAHGGTPAAREEAGEFLTPFSAHFFKAGLGSISEIADGDAPFNPRGCVAQAWSVGEVLRAYWEDVMNMAPPWPHETGFTENAPAAARRPVAAGS